MSYTLALSEEAQMEETEAFNYYEGIRPGLGEELLSELEKSYSKIAENPLFYSYIESSPMLRDVLIEKFPYVVFILLSGPK
jgi:hypothetical protein